MAESTPSPDPELVQHVLSALEEGVPAEVEALSRAVGADEDAVGSALHALASYRRQLASERKTVTPFSSGDDPELAPGTRLGDYVLDDVLGRGAMGVVYRARQESLGNRPVALKVLPWTLVARDPRFVDRFRREAALAARIHHPNLAAVYGFEEVDGTLCFAMRLVEGCTLQEVLGILADRQQAAVRSTSAGYVRDGALLVRRLLDALAVVHAHGLVHRDVKPSNVLLEGAEATAPEEALRLPPVLVDFGLLRPAGDSGLTGTRTLLGTPAYASHETQLGRDVDARADVFSVGALLHDLLTVTSPGSRKPATSGLPPVDAVNPAVDARLAAVVDMALQERVELRYADAAAMREDLDRYLRGEPVHALPAGSLGRLRLWARRNPGRAARAAALGFVATALVVVTTWVLGWAWGLTDLASRARTLEAEGDLLGAAEAYGELAATPRVGLLPWLGDELRRARDYDPPDYDPVDDILANALRHLADGENALESGRATDESGRATDAVAERAFARATDRLGEILFDNDRQHLWTPVRRHLLREARDGEPEFRRRIAMDMWANHLILQEKGEQPVPEGLRGTLVACIDREDVEPETRRAAVAAYGAIREKESFVKMVELLDDEDNEIVRLGMACSCSIFEWLLHETYPDPQDAIGPELMLEWARRSSAMVERVRSSDHGFRDVPCNPGLALPSSGDATIHSELSWLLAAYEERNVTLDLPSQLRSEIAYAALCMRSLEFLFGKALESDVDDEDSATDRARYRRAHGWGVLMHEASIWKQPAPSAGRAAQQVDAAATENEVDFRSENRELSPSLSGTVMEVRWHTADHRRDYAHCRLAHLRMTRPGYSRLDVQTRIPTEAVGLVIHLDDILGTRNQLRNQGSVTARPV